MSSFQQKITGFTERQKHSLERESKLPEPDSDMAGMLKLLAQSFKVIMINMLRELMKEDVA